MMLFSFIIVGLVLLCHPALIVASFLRNTQEILGGTPAAPGEFPTFAHGISNSFLCGGTLIAPDILLTAAHCVLSFEDMALVGGVMLGVDGILVNTISLRFHPSFNGNVNHGHDLLLVKIDRQLQITPQELDFKRVHSGSLVAIGFGQTSEEGDPSPVLLKETLPFVNDLKCLFRDLYINLLFFPKRIMCAGGESGFGVCFGDSGGPLLLDGKQVGISSFGVGCGRRHRSAGFAEIANYERWIKENVCEMSDNPPPGFC